MGVGLRGVVGRIQGSVELRLRPRVAAVPGALIGALPLRARGPCGTLHALHTLFPLGPLLSGVSLGPGGAHGPRFALGSLLSRFAGVPLGTLQATRPLLSLWALDALLPLGAGGAGITLGALGPGLAGVALFALNALLPLGSLGAGLALGPRRTLDALHALGTLRPLQCADAHPVHIALAPDVQLPGGRHLIGSVRPVGQGRPQRRQGGVHVLDLKGPAIVALVPLGALDALGPLGPGGTLDALFPLQALDALHALGAAGAGLSLLALVALIAFGSRFAAGALGAHHTGGTLQALLSLGARRALLPLQALGTLVSFEPLGTLWAGGARRALRAGGAPWALHTLDALQTLQALGPLQTLQALHALGPLRSPHIDRGRDRPGLPQAEGHQARVLVHAGDHGEAGVALLALGSLGPGGAGGPGLALVSLDAVDNGLRAVVRHLAARELHPAPLGQLLPVRVQDQVPGAAGGLPGRPVRADLQHLVRVQADVAEPRRILRQKGGVLHPGLPQHVYQLVIALGDQLPDHPVKDGLVLRRGPVQHVRRRNNAHRVHLLFRDLLQLTAHVSSYRL